MKLTTPELDPLYEDPLADRHYEQEPSSESNHIDDLSQLEYLGIFEFHVFKTNRGEKILILTDQLNVEEDEQNEL